MIYDYVYNDSMYTIANYVSAFMFPGDIDNV